MSNLVEHAKRELERAGNDPDFNESIIKAIQAFAEYGHSGGSAAFAIPMLGELLQFHNLTPLTDDPDEWIEVGDGVWQSTRRPDAFSNDGGVTYRLNSEFAPLHDSNHVLSEVDLIFKYEVHASVVDAVQVVDGNEEKIIKFMERTNCTFELVGDHEILINAYDGDNAVTKKWDWIVCRAPGEFFICPTEAFKAIYEPYKSVTEEPNA